MTRSAAQPRMLLALLAVIVLLFGAPRLPGAARSLGQSLRIFRCEVKQMKKNDQPGPSGAGADTQLGTEDAEASGASRL